MIKEWSLLVFSLLVTAASALIIAYALNGDVPAVKLPAVMLTAALIISFAHLGVRTKGWRAILNVASSPLSREILMVIMTTAMAYLNWFRPGTIHPVSTGRGSSADTDFRRPGIFCSRQVSDAETAQWPDVLLWNLHSLMVYCAFNCLPRLFNAGCRLGHNEIPVA